jgi:DNA-binding protein HU-beta
MNINELSAKVAERVHLTKTDADVLVRRTFEEIAAALENGEKVKIAGFGTFEVKERPARKGLNPSTKEPIEIAASKVVSFKASKGLKESL